MKKNILSILIVCSVIYLSGCVDLKAVNSTATESLTALKKFNEIDATFTRFCQDRCSINLVNSDPLVAVADIKCDCRIENETDNLLKKIYNPIAAYFNALAGLSKDGLTSFNTDALKQSLTTGKFGNVTINEAKVSAYDKFTKAALKILTDGYRKKQLKKAIEEANDPLKTLLDVFKEVMEDLREGYKQEDDYKLGVYDKFLKDSTLAKFGKRQVRAEYYQLLDVSRAKQDQISIFISSLSKVEEAHQKLYDNRNRLKAKDVKNILIENAGTIQELVDEFNKLKTN